MLEKKTVFNNFVKVDEVKFQIPNTEKTITRMVVERGESVSALIVNMSRHSAYFVKQTRIPTLAFTADGFLLEIMAGMIDKGETPEQAVLRELEEELGYQEIIHIRKIASVFLSPGLLTEMNHIFLIYVDDNCARSDSRGIGDENIECVEVPYFEMETQNFRDSIYDAKTLIAVQNYLAF